MKRLCFKMKLGKKSFDLNLRQRKHLAAVLKDQANVMLASFVIYGILESLIQWQLGVIGVGTIVVVLVTSVKLLAQKEKHDSE